MTLPTGTLSSAETASPLAPPSAPAIKPVLRGWFHAGAAVFAVALTALMCWRSWSDVPRMISVAVFGVSMIELYVISALYHIPAWSPPTRGRLRRLDQAGIFVQIASTYTPLCFNILTGWVRPTMLVVIWTLACIGAGGALAQLWRSRRISVGLYICMGWVALLIFPALFQRLPLGGVALLVVGGLIHTAGAIIYARRRPNPWPRVLGFHELFHLCVVGGNGTFAAAIWLWVLPLAHS